MKKILSILLIFAFSLNVPAPNPNVNRRLIYCQNQTGFYTKAFYNVVKSNGGSLTTFELKALTQFEKQFKSEIIKFDRLWFFGLSNRTAAKISFVYPNSTLISEVNAPTFTPYKGFKGNGSTSYLNTNYNAFTGINYSRNSAMFGFWQNIKNTTTDSEGIFVGANQILFYKDPSGLLKPSINDISVDNSNLTNTVGLISMIRTNSTTKYANVNGVNSSPLTRSSSPVPSGFVYIFTRNGGGTFSNSQYACSFFANGTVNMPIFYTCINTLSLKLSW